MPMSKTPTHIVVYIWLPTGYGNHPFLAFSVLSEIRDPSFLRPPFDRHNHMSYPERQFTDAQLEQQARLSLEHALSSRAIAMSAAETLTIHYNDVEVDKARFDCHGVFIKAELAVDGQTATADADSTCLLIAADALGDRSRLVVLVIGAL